MHDGANGMRRAVWTIGMLAALAVGCGGGASSSHPKQPQELDAATRARQAESMLGAGRVADALTAIDDAVKQEPENARWQHMRGAILFRAGRLEEAEISFQRALELDPYLTDARNYLGTIRTEQRRYPEAEELFRKALTDPSYPTPELLYLNLGLLYSAQGRDEDALKELRRAVEVDPKFYRGHFELASTLDRLGRWTEAAREYEVAAPAYTQSGDYFYRIGLAYFRLGDGSKAREKLRRAIDVAPGSESAARADELLALIR